MRDVARSFKEAGLDGLPTAWWRSRGSHRAGRTSAVQRADHASYQEVVRCRSALNRVQGMPFKWTLNPYRGCTHGCHYCFARRYQSQLEMGAGDDFSSVILVKVNFPEVLRRELVRGTAVRDLVALGTATDPYQPAEGHYRLTRRSLQALVDHPTPVALVTKGPLVVRDIDLLVELSRRTPSTVSVSVPTVDETAWERLEPGTAHTLQRLRAVRRLTDAGVDAGVLMAPIVPGITSHPAKLKQTIEAIADHGATFVGASLLHLDGGTRMHFLEFLSREYPDLVEGYGRLYAGKYASANYTSRVTSVLGALTRYGIVKRRSFERTTEKPPDPPPPRSAQQQMLRLQVRD